MSSGDCFSATKVNGGGGDSSTIKLSAKTRMGLVGEHDQGEWWRKRYSPIKLRN